MSRFSCLSGHGGGPLFCEGVQRMNSELSISALLRTYRNGTETPRRVLTGLLRACADAPAGIWISRISEAQLEEFLARLEKSSPEALPLYGIPFAVKDNIDVAGLPTTAACPDYLYRPERSARVVELLVEAGAVPLGKTNMDQFATGLVGVRSPYGAAPNRLAPGYVSGGSSSGSAAALAYGLCSFSLGTDTAGSGRVPAAFNELVGVKPSRGVLSCRGSVPACRSLDCVSLFARSLEDADILLKMTAQFDPEDAYSRVLPERAPLPIRWKFGVPRDEDLEFFGCTAYQEAFRRAVTRMEDAGGEKVTIDFSPFLAAARLLYEGPWVFERYAAVGEFIERHPESVLPVIRSIITPSAPPPIRRRCSGRCTGCRSAVRPPRLSSRGWISSSRRPPEPSTALKRSKRIPSGSTATSDTTPTT